MPVRILTFTLLVLLFLAACNNNTSSTTANTAANNSQPSAVRPVDNTSVGNFAEKAAVNTYPKTVREFFMVLPDKYFTLEGCEPAKDKGCKKAREDYLRNFLEAEDTANGYMKGGCDGAQECMEMALFKKPDGTYVIGVTTTGEDSSNSYFLDYNGTTWTDISAKAVPQYSKKNYYQLPRYGTTVEVFSKKLLDENAEADLGDKGDKMYELEWKNGKFALKK
jgi:hypothetical protein